ncbi:FG-GAP repeat domain-containing protein [Aureliella helgolandensis]|uniref:FG-GAP repeat protein n=1 Tax=Aureliella helgolandensis TaxID=2527968 RepID=A0A518G2W9_9BACT|nr:VCBS repeat-containing protein [Aureliella helgolandensis]QDV22938.1 FG-GAP repeat protein [Aureliella helgolandensis]
MNSKLSCLMLTLLLPWAARASAEDELVLHTFERVPLIEDYLSEGAHAGDFNGDGQADVVYGPYWFEGPGFKTKHEIFEPVPQDRNRYANHFFAWPYDFNGDGFDDVFAVGFCMTPAHVYENPGADAAGKHWRKHEVIDWVSNESPQFANLIGDERPELICTRDSMFGFATIDWEKPFGAWEFHPISTKIAPEKFGHGLGVGDINGDGRQDVLYKNGWFEQPQEDVGNSRWMLHESSFSIANGGADMYAYDVDGDGDNDVITSHSAHGFGLGWYEQVREGDAIAFKHHLIMGSHPSENKYGVLFSELHSVALADMDGDGLKDIVTGKTYWSHHKQSPMWDAGAVVYWFKLIRGKEGVDWIPQQLDGEAGIGRQVSVVDVNADGLPDLVLGGMRGAHVLKQRTTIVSETQWLEAQPKLYDGPRLPAIGEAVAARGPKAELASVTERVAGAIEGESLKSQVSSGSVKTQDMQRFNDDRWSGGSHLWWTGARAGATMTLDLPEFSGTVDLEVVMTCASDYGIVQLSLDDQPLGKPIDLYEANVVTTGVLSFPNQGVKGNRHTLKVMVVGSNPKAKKSMYVALDYLRIKREDGTYAAGASLPAR